MHLRPEKYMMKTFNFFFINCALTIKPQTRHWERHTRRSRQNFNIQNAKFSKLCEILMIKHHLDWMNNSCVKKFSSVNIFLVKNRKLFLWRTKIIKSNNFYWWGSNQWHLDCKKSRRENIFLYCPYGKIYRQFQNWL